MQNQTFFPGIGNGKRILVLSNACFSLTNSNGRTLAKLLYAFKLEDLAQFYVYGIPDFAVCKQYYQVSDSNALTSFLRHRETGHTVTQKEGESMSPVVNGKAKQRKTPCRMLIREMVWRYGKWDGKRLAQWIHEVDPGYLLVFLADNAFLPRLALRLSRKLNIPVIVYSTEDYYFKGYNYVTKRPSVFYYIWHRLLRGSYRKLESCVELGIFNTPMLTELYASEFGFPCTCVFPRSDIDWVENAALPELAAATISYLGNLGLGRHRALMKVADCLPGISSALKIDVYGPATDKIRKELDSHPQIQYRGFVSYENVVKIMHGSTLLLHVEESNPFNNRNLKCAFSTKIADSVCCGTPLLIYAGTALAETAFLAERGCAFVATDAFGLQDVLRTALTDEETRAEILRRAKETREQCFT